jgi:hypothetical protein
VCNVIKKVQLVLLLGDNSKSITFILCKLHFADQNTVPITLKRITIKLGESYAKVWQFFSTAKSSQLNLVFLSNRYKD